jgi:hypothetical protein
MSEIIANSKQFKVNSAASTALTRDPEFCMTRIENLHCTLPATTPDNA